MEGADAPGDAGEPGAPAPRDEDGLRGRVPLREVQERLEAVPAAAGGAEAAARHGARPGRADAELQAGYLFGMLSSLDAVDRSDDAAVDAACAVAKAVNDTAGNVIKLADLSMKAAMLRSSATGRVDVPAFFQDEAPESRRLRGGA